jgi:hypothetical protein
MTEQQKLSKQLAEVNSTARRSDEAAMLRTQARELQNQTNQLRAQIKTNQSAEPSRVAENPRPRPPEYYEQLHRLAGAKGRDAKNLSEVFLMYAVDHEGRFPSNFEQVATYLQKERMQISGTNQFEVVYRGTLDELKGIPQGAVALFRDKETWIAPSGKPARVYGLANGASQIVESEDDFKAWEADHIVSPRSGANQVR